MVFIRDLTKVGYVLVFEKINYKLNHKTFIISYKLNFAYFFID